jgi:hypothetical protein
MPDRSATLFGVLGVVLAAITGVSSIVVFGLRYARVPADRSAAGRAVALAVFVLIWTCAFAVGQIQIGIAG